MSGVDGDAVAAHEVFLQVLLALVAEQRDHGAQLGMAFAHAARGQQVCARAGAAEQAMAAREMTHRFDGLAAGDAEHLVDQTGMSLEDTRYEAIRDAFDLVQGDFAAQQRARFRGFHGE